MNPAIRPLSLLKFGIRSASAFVAHSFAEDDQSLVSRITQFLSKLGVSCDSGLRAEPRSVSDKVKARIAAAELFVGIFTRRQDNGDGSYSTSPWLIEEKAAAIHAGKRLLLFVEEGVQNHIGGMQGDYEYIPFNRSDLADSLIRAMDYVLTLTTVPLSCEIDYATNKVNIKLQAPTINILDEISKLREQRDRDPNNAKLALALADMLSKNKQKPDALAECERILGRWPEFWEAHHLHGHRLQDTGRVDDALNAYQRALDLQPNYFKNYKCLGKCIYLKAKALTDKIEKRLSFEKAKRMLTKASQLSGEPERAHIASDLFLVEEAIADISRVGRSKAPTKRNRRGKSR